MMSTSVDGGASRSRWSFYDPQGRFMWWRAYRPENVAVRIEKVAVEHRAYPGHRVAKGLHSRPFVTRYGAVTLHVSEAELPDVEVMITVDDACEGGVVPDPDTSRDWFDVRVRAVTPEDHADVIEPLRTLCLAAVARGSPIWLYII